MNRQKLLEQAFQRGHLLTVKNKFYRDWINTFIVDEIKADFGKGDITSDAVLKNNQETAVVFSRSDGIAAGIEEVSFILKSYGLIVKSLVKDGDKIKKNTRIFLIKGRANTILKLERTALDMLSRMSGIATLAHGIVRRAGKVGIAPTRKTEWRFIDKKGECSIKDSMDKLRKKLAQADAIIISSPVYFGSISSQLKALFDRTLTLRRNNFQLKGKIGAAISIGRSRNGGQEYAIQAIHSWMHIHGMILVGDNNHFGGICVSPFDKDEIGKKTVDDTIDKVCDILNRLK